MKKALIGVGLAAATFASVAGCKSNADVVSHNLSKDADQFKVNRQIIFINGITDKYLMVIEGYCSLGNDDKPRELSVTCKTGPNQFKKDFVGLSDNVTYTVQQIDPLPESEYHYKVIFKPETIVPNFEH